MALSDTFGDIKKDALQLDIVKQEISNGTENVFHTDLKELTEFIKREI